MEALGFFSGFQISANAHQMEFRLF